MSDNYLRVIPTDPSFVPPRDRAEALLSAVRDLAPNAESVAAIACDSVEFVDAGGNFESIRCHLCGAGLDMAWWSDGMDAAWASRFDDLGVVLPCCRVEASLNDLGYEWPQGFARWRVQAMNPSRGELTRAEVQDLESALAHDIRVIWTHV